MQLHVGRPGIVAAILACPILGAACFRYTGVELADVRPESEVRISLARDAAGYLATELSGDVPVLSGRVVRSGPDSVAVQVNPGERWMLPQATGDVPTVSVPASAIVRIDVKRLHRVKTALVVGAGAVVAGAVLAGRLSNTGHEGQPGDQPPGDALLLRFRLSFPP